MEHGIGYQAADLFPYELLAHPRKDKNTTASPRMVSG